jgi:hypothetical protein
MLFFPQLSTEALVQYPIKKRIYRRAIRNMLVDGSSIEVADFRDNRIVWNLQYAGLSDEERSTFESFLTEVEGALHTFTFIEPGANLLRWSEDLGNSVWLLDPMMQISTLPTDVLGCPVHRVMNAAQAEQTFGQLVTAPGFYRYCFSFHVRADVSCPIKSAIRCGGESVEATCTATQQWKRHFVTGTPGGASAPVRCDITAPAGAVLEVATLQFEAQTTPSAYQRTRGTGHVYPVTRFHEADVQFRANGVDDHAVRLELISVGVPE